MIAYPVGLDPLIDEANRRMRRRRFWVGVLALAAVAIGYSILDGRVPGSTNTGAGSAGDRVTFAGTAQVGGLEVSIPKSFHAHTIAYSQGSCLRHCMVTLTNRPTRTFAWSVSPDQLTTPAASKRVILGLQLFEGIGCTPRRPRPMCAQGTLRLPVTLEDLALPRGAQPLEYGTWHTATRYKRGPGVGVYVISLWIGRDVSRGDRTAALAALRSIRVAR